MRKFISIFFLFLVIPILFVSTIFSIYYYKINKITFPKNIDTVILGDSHTQCSINDSTLTGVANISQRSEEYFLTYNVLKKFIPEKWDVKVVVLGCGFHSFVKQRKDVVTSTQYEKKLDRICYHYFTILDFDSKKNIIVGNLYGVLKRMGQVFKNVLYAVVNNYKEYKKYDFIGKYYRSNYSNLTQETTKSTLNRHYYHAVGFSENQIEYIDRIIQYCEMNNIRLVLVNTPINRQYSEKIPQKFKDNYYKHINKYRHRVVFWDFHDFPLEDSCFGDADHLNFRGATIFTKVIKSELEELKYKSN